MSFLTFLDYVIVVVPSIFLTSRISESLIYSAVIICALYAFRLYDYTENLINSLTRSLFGVAFGSIFLFVICKLFRSSFFSIKVFFMFLALVFVFPIVNYALGKLVSKNIKTIRYLVIGRDDELSKVLKEIEEKSNKRYRFVEYMNPSPVVLRQKISHYDRLLIADPQLEKSIEEELINIKQNHKVEYLPNLAERVLKRIPIEVVEKFEDYYKVCFDNIKESPAKRILDVVLALVGLILYSPFILLSSFFILLEDGRPVVFKQLRVGKDKKEYLMLKLRSMKEQLRETVKFADDENHRILKIGRIIRATRIDESLQFINVLKGDMSIVGPRPEQAPFSRFFEDTIPCYSLRYKVKPGITGWAQICYKYSSTVEETKVKLSYDLYYVKNRNILLDFKILLLTLETIIFGKGAK
ncbi:sugar transferase [Pseudothermotoga sp. U03pept]|uniref:sugar transferase n=1 Tax=Pseudothermotoga sp. U03pept TaxID=3447012 RepID=UPI003F122B47